jgi:hypothetical protein
MNDAQRYSMNAAECLSAAERYDPTYRGLTLAIASSWLSLARQQEAMVELLAIWSNASSATSTVSSPQSFILSTFTSPHSPLPPAGGYVAIQVWPRYPKGATCLHIRMVEFQSRIATDQREATRSRAPYRLALPHRSAPGSSASRTNRRLSDLRRCD